MMDELKQRGEMVKIKTTVFSQILINWHWFSHSSSDYQLKKILDLLIVTLVYLTLMWQIKMAAMIAGAMAVK